MSKGKARYNAPTTFADTVRLHIDSELPNFSESLHLFLRQKYMEQSSGDVAANPSWGHPADNFVEEVLGESRWIFGWRDDLSRSLSKKDLDAEQSNLLTKVRGAAAYIDKYPNKAEQKDFSDLKHRLRKVSDDLHRLLPAGVDLRGCAEALDAFPSRVTASEICSALIRLAMQLESTSANAVEKLRDNDAEHYLAKELVARLSPLLHHYQFQKDDVAVILMEMLRDVGISKGKKILLGLIDELENGSNSDATLNQFPSWFEPWTSRKKGGAST